jgi:hypothetical protein
MFLWKKCGAWDVRYFEEREAPSWTLLICPAPTSAPRDANPCLSEGCISTVWLGKRHCLFDYGHFSSSPLLSADSTQQRLRGFRNVFVVDLPMLINRYAPPACQS